MIFPRQGQFLLLGKFLAHSRRDGFHFGAFLSCAFPLFFYGFIQPLAEKVVHTLKQAGQAELVVKGVAEIVWLELLSARALKNDPEAVL